MATSLTPAELASLRARMDTVLNARERKAVLLSVGYYSGGGPANDMIDREETDLARLEHRASRTRKQIAAERLGLSSTERFDEIVTEALVKLRAQTPVPKPVRGDRPARRDRPTRGG